MLRGHVDELVVVTDAAVDDERLEVFDPVADLVVSVEAGQLRRSLPWLRERVSADWLLVLGAADVPGPELLDRLAGLCAARDVAGWSLPAWWVGGDATSRLDAEPWCHDRLPRLVRNDDRISFPAAGPQLVGSRGPVAVTDLAVLRLDLVLDDLPRRAARARRDEGAAFGRLSRRGLPWHAGHLVPELVADPVIVTLPPPSAALVAAALAPVAPHDAVPTRQPRTSLTTAELARWIASEPMPDDGFAGALRLVDPPETLVAASRTTIVVEVVNRGGSVWPATAHTTGAPVNLAHHWFDALGSAVVFDGVRTPLPHRIAPGETALIEIDVEAPTQVGVHRLAVDLVQETVRWFGLDVALGASATVTVTESITDRLRPWSASATPVPVDAALALRRLLDEPDGMTRACAVGRDERVDDELGLVVGGWAVDHDTLRYLLDRIRHAGVRRILEFGSGSSTVVLAGEVARRGGQVLSVDESDHYARITEAQLAERGLDGHATVLRLPIAPVTACGLVTSCYSIGPEVGRRIREFAPEFVLIDGPSSATGASRLGVAAQLVAVLGGRRVEFAMDDAWRDAELEIARHWASTEGITVDGVMPVGKGLLVGFIGT